MGKGSMVARPGAKIQGMGKTEVFLVRTVWGPGTSLVETGENNASEARLGLDLWALEDAMQCHLNKAGGDERGVMVGQGQNEILYQWDRDGQFLGLSSIALYGSLS